MVNTKLIYLNNMEIFTCNAQVLDIIDSDNKKIIILDQTIFYPQGGGQPYDTGIIENKNAKFIVQEVRFVDGIVRHIGTFESGTFNINDQVTCYIDEQRRILNSKLHAAGHLIDMAVANLKLNWIPSKGYHFPEGPYVEYNTQLDNMDKEKLRQDIEITANNIISQDIKGEFFLCSKEELAKYCDNIPEYLPKDKPIRVVKFANLAIPCGGTHVNNLKELKQIFIKKIKPEKANIRISYDILRD